MSGFVRLLALVGAASLLFGAPARANDWILGPAHIVDGDTVEIEGQRLHLYMVDAPEPDQMCTDQNGHAFGCGKQAIEGLQTLIAGRDLLCHPGPRTPDGGLLAVCDAGDGDIAALMVRHGYALTFGKISARYAQDQTLARKAATGVWAGLFEKPWHFRQRLIALHLSDPARDAPAR